MSEFAQPLSSRDCRWIELREQLARIARELHFAALASDAANGPALLTAAENLAKLAMSIPMSSTPSVVDFSTWLNARNLAGVRTPKACEKD